MVARIFRSASHYRPVAAEQLVVGSAAVLSGAAEIRAKGDPKLCPLQVFVSVQNDGARAQRPDDAPKALSMRERDDRMHERRMT